MKPVTYLKRDDSTGLYYECDKEYGFPVYTHPVKEEAEQQSYQEADGCPTELAVLQRFWRKAQEK